MCDTLVARGSVTAAGELLFAKNSDREANEAQALVHMPSARHEPGAQVACTYISVPQVAETYGVLLSKPYWMWGAEMGANDKGLVIGNEAVFASVPPPSEPALLGMDILRLTLERAANLAEAVETIADLLATHGQGGNCAHTGKFEYHNSFLIADAAGEACVMETIGREWAVENVRDRRSISNTYTIGDRIDRQSEALASLARKAGWKEDEGPFHLAEIFTDRLRTRFASGKERWCRTTALMDKAGQGLSGAHCMAILRDNGPKAALSKDWRPDGVLGGAVCAHASWGPARRAGQTTGSWVTEMRRGRTIHWVTGTSAPDTGIFKPVLFGPGWEEIDLPGFGPEPTGTYDPSTLWWRHERLHRAVLADYGPRMDVFAADRDRLERDFVARLDQLCTEAAPVEAFSAWMGDCWKKAAEAEEKWLRWVEAVRPRRGHRGSPFYRMHWHRLNRQARFPQAEAPKV